MPLRSLLTVLLYFVLAFTEQAQPSHGFDQRLPRIGHSQLETGIYHIEVDSRSLSFADEKAAKLLCEALIGQISEEGDYEILAWRQNQYEANEKSHFKGTSHSIIIWTANSSKSYHEAHMRYIGKPAPEQASK